MRIKLFLAVLLVAMTSAMPAALANRELLAIEQYPLLWSLEDMYWQEDLSREDIRKVITALESKKHTLGETVLIVVALHNLSETVPVLRKGIGRYGRANKAFAEMLVDAFARGADPVTYLRAASIEETPMDRQMAGLPDRMLADDGLSLGEMATLMIVITEAKALRSGLTTEPNTDGRTLSSFHRRLLAYSAMDRSTAIAGMLAEVSNIKISGARVSVTMKILRTFGQAGVDAVLKRVSRAAKRRDASEYGLSNFLQFLGVKAHSMDAATKRKTRRIVGRLGVTWPSLARGIKFVNRELSE